MLGDIYLVFFAVMLLSGIAALIVRARMRRHIERTTGIRPKNESELTSLNTWMAVAEKEEQRKAGKS